MCKRTIEMLKEGRKPTIIPERKHTRKKRRKNKRNKMTMEEKKWNWLIQHQGMAEYMHKREESNEAETKARQEAEDGNANLELLTSEAKNREPKGGTGCTEVTNPKTNRLTSERKVESKANQGSTQDRKSVVEP